MKISIPLICSHLFKWSFMSRWKGPVILKGNLPSLEISIVNNYDNTQKNCCLTGNTKSKWFKLFPTELHKPRTIGRTDASLRFNTLFWTRACPWPG